MTYNTFIPLCMTAAEHAAWLAANERAERYGVGAPRPCFDCPIAFAEEMRLAMKCNGSPRVFESKTEPRRLLQWREARARRKAGIRIRRSSAERAVMIARIGEMYESGMTTREIVEATGVSADYARDARTRAEARAA